MSVSRNYSRALRLVSSLATLILFLSSLPAGNDKKDRDDDHGADLRIVEEFAPAGGLALFVIELTEPKPITKGEICFTMSQNLALAPVDESNVALLSGSQDVFGSATVEGDEIVVQFDSPNATFGNEDMPVMLVAVPVLPDAASGETLSVDIDESRSFLLDPQEQPYALSVKQNPFTVDGVSINQIIPASGLVPAGEYITVLGMGFEPGVRIDFQEVGHEKAEFISSTELRVLMKSSFLIQPYTRVRLRNSDPDRATDLFYPAASQIGLQPVSSTAAVGLARLWLPHFVMGAGWFTEIALSNRTDQPGLIEVWWTDEQGHLVQEAQSNPARVLLAAGERAIMRGQDLFGPAADELRIGSLVFDTPAGTAAAAWIGKDSDPSFRSAVPVTASGMRESAFAQASSGRFDGFDLFTGLAIHNGNPEAVRIRIDVLDARGGQAGWAQVTLPPGGRLSRLLSEWIPGLPPQSGGRVRLSSALPVQALEFSGDLQGRFLKVVPASPSKH